MEKTKKNKQTKKKSASRRSKKVVKKSAKKAGKAPKTGKPFGNTQGKSFGKASRKNIRDKQDKPVGTVVHFYTKIKVAVIKFKVPFRAGSDIRFGGATTDFKQNVSSMQYDHKPVRVAKKGQSVGVKVAKRVREGDMIYLVK